MKIVFFTLLLVFVRDCYENSKKEVKKEKCLQYYEEVERKRLQLDKKTEKVRQKIIEQDKINRELSRKLDKINCALIKILPQRKEIDELEVFSPELAEYRSDIICPILLKKWEKRELLVQEIIKNKPTFD